MVGGEGLYDHDAWKRHRVEDRRTTMCHRLASATTSKTYT